MSASPAPGWTKGPWTLQELPAKHLFPEWIPWCVRADNNVHIATVGDVDRFFEKQQAANARLIASAPELYEALRELSERVASLGGVEIPYADALKLFDAYKQARAALARAEKGGE